MLRALLSPEAQLVLLSAGGPENDAALCELVGQGLAWDDVAYLASHERAAPVLWRRLRAVRGELTEDAGVRTLAGVAQFWEFRLARLEQLLDGLLRALETAGIDVVLLKGAGLALTLYPTFGDRPMADIDLLVPARDASRVWELAREHGWRWDEVGYPRARYARHHHLPPLFDPLATGASLEIHTDVVAAGEPFRFLTRAIWDEAVTHRLDGRVFKTPSLVHQFLHTCVHFAWSHCLTSKTWRTFRDVRAFGEHGLPWARALDEARELRADTCVYWTLRLAADLSHVPVPREVLAAAQPRGPAPALDLLARHHALSALPSRAGCPSASLSRWMWRASIRRGPNALAFRGFRDADPPPGQDGTGPMLQRLARHAANREVWGRYAGRILGLSKG